MSLKTTSVNGFQIKRDLLVFASGLLTFSTVLVLWGPKIITLWVPVLAATVAVVALVSGFGISRPGLALQFSELSIAVLVVATVLGSTFTIFRLIVLEETKFVAFGLFLLASFALLLGWLIHRRMAEGQPFVIWIILLVVAILIIVLSREPVIDVLIFERDGAAALLRGQNPYAITFQSPFPVELNSVFFGDGVYDGETLLFGFPYPPPPLFSAAFGALLGDVRVGAMSLHFFASLALYRTASDIRSRQLAILFLFSPGFLLNAVTGWTELVCSSLLALTLCALIARSRWTPFLMGIFAVSKQYMPFFVPLAPLLVPEARRLPGGIWRNLAVTAVVSGTILIPFVIWGPREFMHSVVALQFDQPWRSDAFSLLVWWGEVVSEVPRWVQSVLPLGSALAISIVLGSKAIRAPWAFSAAIGVVMCVMALLAKQAFSNYFAFSAAAVLIGAILLGSGSAESNTSEPHDQL